MPDGSHQAHAVERRHHDIRDEAQEIAIRLVKGAEAVQARDEHPRGLRGLPLLRNGYHHGVGRCLLPGPARPLELGGQLDHLPGTLGEHLGDGPEARARELRGELVQQREPSLVSGWLVQRSGDRDAALELLVRGGHEVGYSPSGFDPSRPTRKCLTLDVGGSIGRASLRSTPRDQRRASGQRRRSVSCTGASSKLLMRVSQ